MQGKYKDARSTFQRIAGLQRKHGLGGTHSYYETIRGIAYMHYFLGDKEKAFALLSEYFRGLDNYSYEVFFTFNERAWHLFLSKFLGSLHDLLGWVVSSADQSRYIREAYDLALNFKNRLYDEEFRWKKRYRANPRNPALDEYYRLLSETYATSNHDEQYIRQRQIAEEEISEHPPMVAQRVVTLDQLQRELTDRELILDYIYYNTETVFDAFREPERGYLVFVITNHSIRLYDLGPAEDLDDSLEEFYKEVSFPDRETEYLDQQLLLLKARIGLFDFAEDLEKAEVVYLGTDGKWMPRMPWQYFFPGQKISVLPSFAVFDHIKKEANSNTEKSGQIAVFTSADPGNDPWMDRALQIARASEVLLDDMIGDRLHIYSGDGIGKAAFLSVRSPYIFHVAAHGFVSEDAGQAKSIMMIGGKNDVSRAEVTLVDIMQMDLSGTELVVLNSCKTGLGNFRNDEGVYSFARAFLIAGAKTILTCLWDSDAAFSVIFLDYFYEYFLSGTDAEDALKRAKVAVREMSKRDVYGWLEYKKTHLKNRAGVERLDALAKSIDEWNGHETEHIFDVPAYWASFVLTSSEF